MESVEKKAGGVGNINGNDIQNGVMASKQVGK